jgi:hypothetical protein
MKLTSQASQAIAIGYLSGQSQQAVNAIAIGPGAGNAGQVTSAIAIGLQAGFTNQGTGAVAIGDQAGYADQVSNSIIINATGLQLNATQAGFYVAPIRDGGTSGLPVGFSQLAYNSNTGELVFYS